MIPRVAVWIARYASRGPFRIQVVPDIPLVSARDAALMSPDESQVAEELVHVELQRLRQRQIVSIEIDVIRKGMQRRNKRAVRVRHSLRRESPDQMVIEKRVRVEGRPAHTELCR